MSVKDRPRFSDSARTKAVLRTHKFKTQNGHYALLLILMHGTILSEIKNFKPNTSEILMKLIFLKDSWILPAGTMVLAGAHI